MIKKTDAFGGTVELTFSSAMHWMSLDGFGGPYDLTTLQRIALPAFLESRDTVYPFLKRAEFLTALDTFIAGDAKYARIWDAIQRSPKQILFVGAIDGGPELEFLERYVVWPCAATITSYGAASKELSSLRGVTVRGNIDATKLLASFPPASFDLIVWIGPTCDGHLEKTPELVGQFVKSAAYVLRKGGVTCVIQDLKTPNFRPILDLDGAFYCEQVSLRGRTKTQHSQKKEVMDGRTDQMIAFTYDGVLVQPVETQNNEFLDVFSRIMSAPAALFKATPHSTPKTKKEIADIIFEYAKNV